MNAKSTSKSIVVARIERDCSRFGLVEMKRAPEIKDVPNLANIIVIS